MQDEIFRAISRDGKNLFMVGDVKQSIYRFRLADPGIFTEKYLSYADCDAAAPGEPRRIMLRENFRSRPEVLESANHVFRNIMSRELGELEYDEAAALRPGPGRDFPEGGGAPTEFCILTPPGGGEDEDDDVIKVAIVGKPNVGKSSLINYLAGEERVIVSDIAGTTRGAADSVIENEYGKYIFIDTAGIRRKAKVADAIERYSVLRSYMAVDRCDVAIILIDAVEGFSEQDSKIAGYAHEQGKACIVCVNKWDAVEKDDRTMKEYTDKLKVDFSFMSYVPFLFISAKTGQRVDKMFPLINEVAANSKLRIPTGRLNDLLSYATARVQPPSDKGKRLKIYYMTQASTQPPTFVCFCNSAELFHFSYQRYLENQIRETYDLTGTPIRMMIRERGD